MSLGEQRDPRRMPISMNDPDRVRALHAEAVRQAELDEGDFIEMGVFLGGTAAMLARVMKRLDNTHLLHLLDSWEGFEPLTEEDRGTFYSDLPADESARRLSALVEVASEEQVRTLLENLGLLGRCRTYRGFFRDTLHRVPGPFALAHVDCDFYEPIKQCLEHVMPRMTANGVIVVDDFGTQEMRRFPGVKKAVEEMVSGSAWRIVALPGRSDAPVKLVRD